MEGTTLISKKGFEVLSAFLEQESHIDVLGLEEGEFSRWLTSFNERLLDTDATYRQRTHIRDLQRKHSKKLQVLKERLRDTEVAYKKSSKHEQLESLQEKVNKGRLAVAGLGDFLAAASAGSRKAEADKTEAANLLSDGYGSGPLGFETDSIDTAEQAISSDVDCPTTNAKATEQAAKQARKLKQAKEKLQDAEGTLKLQLQDLKALQGASPEWQALQEAQAMLQGFKEEVGLLSAEATLQQLSRSAGHTAVGGGRKFEHIATQVVHNELIPELIKGLPSATLSKVDTLSNVTLGLALGELDKVVIVKGDTKDAPVQVLAVVECKKNINDVAHGFTILQSVLSWLSCEKAGYDASLFRTRKFPSGHFDRATFHQQSGQTYTFTPESFRTFQRGPEGYYLEGLYFIVTPGSITGLDSALQNQLASRISTDLHFPEAIKDNQEQYLRALQDWARTTKRTVLNTRQVLSLFQGSKQTAGNVVFYEVENGLKDNKDSEKSR